MPLAKDPLTQIKYDLCMAIEPALQHFFPPLRENIDERIRHHAVERDACAKVEACLEILRRAGMLKDEA